MWMARINCDACREDMQGRVRTAEIYRYLAVENWFVAGGEGVRLRWSAALKSAAGFRSWLCALNGIMVCCAHYGRRNSVKQG